MLNLPGPLKFCSLACANRQLTDGLLEKLDRIEILDFTPRSEGSTGSVHGDVGINAEIALQESAQPISTLPSMYTFSISPSPAPILRNRACNLRTNAPASSALLHISSLSGRKAELAAYPDQSQSPLVPFQHD